jgi:serine phosphatase RsbU (regulator of sigma subunit)
VAIRYSLASAGGSKAVSEPGNAEPLPVTNALAKTVGQLTAEVNDLRQALRRRAVIEQATGLLAGQLGCRLGEAFRHLNRIAQETDATLAEAASLLLVEGMPSPEQPGDDFLHLPAGTILANTEPAHPDAGLPADPVSLVDLVPVPALLLSPMREADGEITDFIVVQGNDESGFLRDPQGGPVIGMRARTMFPAIDASGLFGTFVQTMKTGRKLKLDLFPFEGLVNGKYRTQSSDIRAQRAGGYLVLCWRAHDTASDRQRRLQQAQRLGRVGWAEWNLFSDTVTWSYEMYEMHARDLADGPLTLEEYRRVVHPDDLPVLEGLMRNLHVACDDIEVEFRIMADDEIRHLSVIAKTVFDPGGRPLLMRSVFQDVTARRSAEQAVAQARAKVEHERREATLNLQRALLPPNRRELRTAQYDVSVRYLSAAQAGHSGDSAQAGNKVGGDWYEARIRPDGTMVIAVGDVAGHGLDAAAGMARISNALRGLTMTAQGGDQTMSWLNDLVCQEENPETIASAVIGTLEPGRPRLRWAQAGHPNPVLVRDGEARLLDRPKGLMLGTVPGVGYTEQVTDLAEGDLLILYTDGLIERRGRDIDDGLRGLLAAAAACRGGTANEFIIRLLARCDVTASGDDVCVLVVRVTG